MPEQQFSSFQYEPDSQRYQQEPHDHLSFRFEGWADITNPSRPDYQDVISSSIAAFNSEADRIADDTVQVLKEYLPASGSFLIELRFYEGSITWIGIIEVLNWVGRIVDVVGFVEIAVRVIRFASNRAIRKAANAAAIP